MVINKIKALRALVVYAAFIVSLQNFAQSNYNAPSYTFIHSVSTISLPNSNIDSAAKKLNFSTLTNNFDSSLQDGFMLRYECTDLQDNWTDLTLLKIESDGKIILEVYFDDNNGTLKLRRFHDGKFVDYLLYDRLFPEFHGPWTPMLKFYFGKDFIFIESESSNVLLTNTLQTPVFWGINTTNFLNKSSSANIHLYKPLLNYHSNDVFIYGFKTATLLNDLNKCFINPTANAAYCNGNGGGGRVPRSTATNTKTPKDNLVERTEEINEVNELDGIKVFPNPVDNHLLNIAFPSVALNQDIFVTLMDINGRIVLQKNPLT